MTTIDQADSSMTKQSAKPLFRLVKLIRESQCELEIVKPVLDELETMRLCCSFGMMSSVNLQDFDFDVLHAREFDEDFARFIRCDLFENKCAGKVRVKGLFGKQTQVLATLIDMNACLAEMATLLTKCEEGVYCVMIEEDVGSSSKQGEGEKVDAGLVVFSWIRDELFEPQALRDTPALVLRLLTVLTSDIICCTSALDLEQLRAAMLDSEKQQDESLSPYSVSFAIEKQQDAHDGTVCVARNSVDLENAMKDCQSVCLLKGKYPALMLTKTSGSKTRTEPFQRTFTKSTKMSFATWLRAESQQYRIELNGTIARSLRLCESILREFDMWPEAEVTASQQIHETKKQEEYELTSKRLDDEIARQRAAMAKVANVLFQVGPSNSTEEDTATLYQSADMEYESYRKWAEANGLWKLDQKAIHSLDIPIHLREIAQPLFDLHLQCQEVNIEAVLSMCATSTKTQLLQAIAKLRAGQQSCQLNHCSTTAVKSFSEKVAEPLLKLRKLWWFAVESSLALVKPAWIKSYQKHVKSDMDEGTKRIIQDQFEQVRKLLQSKCGSQLILSASMRKGSVFCNGKKVVETSGSVAQEVLKLEVSEGASNRMKLNRLGSHHVVDTNETHVAMFTVKTRSAIQVCALRERMCVKFLHFPPGNNTQQPSHASEKVVRTFGKIASVCDFDCRSRIMTFLAEDSVGIYKFDEAFKQMDRMKVIDLGARSTLSALPFTNIVLLESTVYVTDSSGCFQGIGSHTDEISNVGSMVNESAPSVQSSCLMPFADKLAVGMVSTANSTGGGFVGELKCVSLDDFRRLPVLPLGVEFLTDNLQVQRVAEGVVIVDTVAQKLYLFSIEVTVQSDSYRLQQFDENDEDKDANVSEAEPDGSKCLRKQHWLYTFYHVFEKFPVFGLLDNGRPRPVSVLATCPISANLGIALEDCHNFLSLLMSDLMALNKPVYGLDLTKGLGVRHASLAGVNMETMSLSNFFLTLITFLPVQICRAEANTLTLLRDGMSQPLEPEMKESSWGTADIAETIRFGLLSPLLCAWQGRCVVITSMGKQSTGKSYFLNHLTGSTFAIAGSRCTDGAWMSLRVLEEVLLVVLDFEGLGSFERTDQEDVFLAMLNASLSMFTIFRMEMRLDKEIDNLFSKFQKGINLLKNDKRLFQGTLYMSVKDINLDDGRGVLSEFKSKIDRLLRSTRERNFLTDMYSGKVSINCSPPLGTRGYYDSLRHAKQLVQKVIVQADTFRTGDSFHDCLRLVLAKISTLDWTTADETSQQLQMRNLCRKVYGVIRTGCLVPVDFQSNESVPGYLREAIVHTESEMALLRFETLAQDHPEWLRWWPDAAQEVDFDNIVDTDIDFGPSVCTQESVSTESVHSFFVELFEQYLTLTSKGVFEMITEDDYAHFDVMVSFLVNRRKTRVALWVKKYLGPDRFMDEWNDFEQVHLVPFEALVKRCVHVCAECQLQCMRSACHPLNEGHDCGMSHVCRGLCEFCSQCYDQQDEMPRCVGKAGHEGKCNCGKSDHTCGKMCDLSEAWNCELNCELKVGHDGGHQCSVKRHICGVSCSVYKCGGKCVCSVERMHSVHKCAETQCIYNCEMDGCKKRCTETHFHGNAALARISDQENERLYPSYLHDARNVRHMCDSSHTCYEFCQEAGICKKDIYISKSQFSGTHDKFNYDLKRMVGVRNKCAIVLKPGQTNHDDVLHSCVKQAFDGTANGHGCTAKCEACEYYCEKPIGHRGMHATAHGSMRNMQFIAKMDKIDWDGRKYAPGEAGIAEMCNLYCSTAGRGHVHYLKCVHDSADDCVYSGMEDQRRHCNASQLEPRPKYEVDEVLHAEYWKTIGWEDPCHSAAERAQFSKCPYLCTSIEHERNASDAGCCLPAWHSTTIDQSYVLTKYGTYINGHFFACSHATQGQILHHIFVLDCSGSMRGNPWRELVKGTHEYLLNRMRTGYNQDIVSVVTFGDSGKIDYERVKIGNAVTRYVNYRGGETYYARGLKEANALISRTNTKMYKPVLTFFTDGCPADRKEGMKQALNIRQHYAVIGLRVFVVGCGRVNDAGLEDLAKHLGGSVHKALSIDNLVDTFRLLSVSLGARAGLIRTSV